MIRSLGALVLAFVLALVVTAGLASVTPTSGRSVGDLGAALVVPLAGGLLGIGIGGLLHRPIVRHLGLTVVAASAPWSSASRRPRRRTCCTTSPPVHGAAAYLLLAATTSAATVLTAAAAGLVGRRAR